MMNNFIFRGFLALHLLVLIQMMNVEVCDIKTQSVTKF